MDGMAGMAQVAAMVGATSAGWVVLVEAQATAMDAAPPVVALAAAAQEGWEAPAKAGRCRN